MQQSLEDHDLIRQVVAARPEALAALYDRYGRLVFSLAARILGDDALAEEVTQDVFVQLWKKAATYRAEAGRVSTWLTSFARNRSIDLLRQRSVRPEGHRVEWEADDLSEDLPGESDLEGAVETRLQGQRIQAALSGLPPDQRTVLALAYFQGLSHSEIAAELDQPLGTVKTRLRLAMQKLRQALVDEPQTLPPGAGGGEI